MKAFSTRASSFVACKLRLLYQISRSNTATEQQLEENVRLNVVKRSSLADAARIYPNLTQESIINGFNSPAGKPYPYFVPSIVNSTLGSPTALAIGAFATTLTTLCPSASWAGEASRSTTSSLGISSSLLVSEWSSRHNGNWYLETRSDTRL